ncbi:MAG: S-layer protein, partial [archaeon]
MKKIVAGAAALGVSALLAGSVVAANVNGDDFGSFNELTKDQLFTSGVPAYNIVVGSMGQTIDVVWAGNIAAAIGKKAYMSAEEAGTGSYTFNNVVVTVGTEAGATVTGDGYLSDKDMAIQMAKNVDEKNISLINTDYSVLYDDDVYGNITGNSNFTVRETETLDVNFNTFFSKNNNVKDLVTFIERGDIKYELAFGDPIVFDANKGEFFAIGDTLPVHFMGGIYELQTASFGSTPKVTLVGSGSKMVKRT